MIITRNRVDIMDAISWNQTGMGFIDFAKLKHAELTAAKAEAEAAKEAAKEADSKNIKAMLKADFSIERIADILNMKIDYVKELAEIKA